MVLGVALIVAAVATGAAQLDLVVIVPVIVGGASVVFLAGIVSVVAGIFLLPLAFSGSWAEAATTVEAMGFTEDAGSGGLVLIGPLPIFFGSWKNVGPRAYWIAAGVGLAFLVGLIVVAALLA